MLALGLCNLIGSFFKSSPTCGAFTRSAVSQASGVRTPLAGVYSGKRALPADHIPFINSKIYYRNNGVACSQFADALLPFHSKVNLSSSFDMCSHIHGITIIDIYIRRC